VCWCVLTSDHKQCVSSNKNHSPINQHTRVRGVPSCREIQPHTHTHTHTHTHNENESCFYDFEDHVTRSQIFVKVVRMKLTHTHTHTRTHARTHARTRVRESVSRCYAVAQKYATPHKHTTLYHDTPLCSVKQHSTLHYPTLHGTTLHHYTTQHHTIHYTLLHTLLGCPTRKTRRS
jgi:hypothetical protein